MKLIDKFIEQFVKVFRGPFFIDYIYGYEAIDLLSWYTILVLVYTTVYTLMLLTCWLLFTYLMVYNRNLQKLKDSPGLTLTLVISFLVFKFVKLHLETTVLESLVLYSLVGFLISYKVPVLTSKFAFFKSLKKSMFPLVIGLLYLGLRVEGYILSKNYSNWVFFF